MAFSGTAILLRDGTHESANIRYGLRAEQVSVSIVKSPIQIPIPRNTPELIDIGIFRPSITISGLVDSVGGNTSTDDAGMEGMKKFEFTDVDDTMREYFFPYKNKLEEAAYQWIAQESSGIELEIGDAKYPVYNIKGNGVPASSGTNFATGGAIYQVAIQQFRVQQDAAKEDRWQYTFQFVAKARTGVQFIDG